MHPVLQVEEGIEVTSRTNENGKFYFVMNHNAAEKQIVLPEGKWEVLLDGYSSNLWRDPFVTEGTVKVDSHSVLVLGQTGK